jgi:hypothetical protein
MFCIALSLLSLGALAEELSKVERFKTSFAQFTGAKSLVYELKRDPKCQKKTFSDFDPENWLSAIPGGVSQKEKTQLKEVALKGFEVMSTTKAPNSDKSLSELNYLATKEMVKKIVAATPGENTGDCEAVYEIAKGLFQQSKDALRLMN